MSPASVNLGRRQPRELRNVPPRAKVRHAILGCLSLIPPSGSVSNWSQITRPTSLLLHKCSLRVRWVCARVRLGDSRRLPASERRPAVSRDPNSRTDQSRCRGTRTGRPCRRPGWQHRAVCPASRQRWTEGCLSPRSPRRSSGPDNLQWRDIARVIRVHPPTTPAPWLGKSCLPEPALSGRKSGSFGCQKGCEGCVTLPFRSYWS